MSKPLKILVSAFACGPKWGSEIGMGWNWVLSTSNYCKLTVITESYFQNDIEEVVSELDVKFIPDFHYVDIGERGRELFWKQGSASFYNYYRKWQKQALNVAESMIEKESFDIIHQLNMIGYREPGYLWRIKDIPFVFGPVGGYNQFPYSFFSILNFRDKIFYFARNVINKLQMHFLVRPLKAYKRANFVILATPSGDKIVSKYTKKPPILLSETGAHKLVIDHKPKLENDKLVLVWVGLIAGRKALPIALKSIAKSKYQNKLVLKVIGDGPNIDSCKTLAVNLGLNNVDWYGGIPNDETKKVIADADMLFFTSVLDATSTVVFEALQADTPVMCHDTCGFGNVIDETCGVKIPLKNVSSSIQMFSQKIDELIEHPQKLQYIKNGCKVKIKDYYWNEKGEKLYNIYKKCLM
ncbi:hypothetical protein GCM10022393_20460 [Aquimarina addita]|uniref:Glycosyl transferase family 1 domain-containing protein n=1 Tax=Aquimarina addita TaxID=870485 RepID=A0ABP6UL17_9FLAO